MRIILASSSPRRKELLENVGIDFIIDASSIDEKFDETLPFNERLQQLAIDKATPIHDKYPHDVVIGADTIVYYDHQIIGKAHDVIEARQILEKLSDHQHKVYTAVAIYIQNELYSFVECTDVYFKDITFMIDEYLISGEWQGKAGAYGIQGWASNFVDHIEGDRNNVIGLPVQRILDILRKKSLFE